MITEDNTHNFLCKIVKWEKEQNKKIVSSQFNCKYVQLSNFVVTNSESHSDAQSLLISRWFMVINYTIHGIVYSYYTLKATTEMKPHSPSNHDLPFFPSFLTQKQALKYKKCQSNGRGQRTIFWPLFIMDTCKNHLLKRFEFKIQLIST